MVVIGYTNKGSQTNIILYTFVAPNQCQSAYNFPHKKKSDTKKKICDIQKKREREREKK